jgi:hypothetical protein
MKTQKILTDIKLVSLLKYMGYPVTVKSDNLGSQYLVTDPGDLQEAIDAYESGTQVADSKKLLETYASLSGQSAVGPAQAQEFIAPLNATQIFSTRNIAVMGLLQMYGFILHIDYNAKDGKIECRVHDDGTAKTIMAMYKRAELTVNAYAFDKAMFAVRTMLKNAKKPQPFLPASLSNQSEAQ